MIRASKPDKTLDGVAGVADPGDCDLGTGSAAPATSSAWGGLYRKNGSRASGLLFNAVAERECSVAARGAAYFAVQLNIHSFP